MRPRNNVRFDTYLTIKLEVDDSRSIDISPSYVRDEYTYIRKSKKTLLMFRRL